MKINGIYACLLMLSFACITSCKEEKTDPPPTPPANEVIMNGDKFLPATITVTTGTTVKWTNKEADIHTVTSDNGTFNSGNMGMNAAFSFTFTSAGVYPYHCIHHAGMTGTVIVQ